MTLLIDQPAVTRRDAGVVAVSGPDRVSYLHTLLSQHLEDAIPGTVADFLHLDAKGNPRAAGRAVVRDADVLLVVPAQVAPELAEALESSKFLVQVEAADVSADWALATVRGPGARVDGAPEEPMRAVSLDVGLLVRGRSSEIDLLGPEAWIEERLADLGLPEAGPQEWEAARILAGEPGWGTEIAPGRRPQELGLLPTHVHLRKGCYPGQESIAKTYNLGSPRRALAVVEFAEPVQPGDTVAGKGTVTSAAPYGDGAVALALLPVDGDGGLPDKVDDPPGAVLARVGEGLPQPGAAT